MTMRIRQKRISDRELLTIFPEAKEILPEKIKEWESEQAKMVEIIKKKLTLIKQRTNDEFSAWFWREWVKLNEGKEILTINNHISRIKRLLTIASGQTPKGFLTDEQIQEALEVPIESLIDQPLKKSGKTLVGLCPLHNEKHPSFCIYPETNSCWCFGCNQGGNTINFVRLLHGYDFKEAVQYLTRR